MLTPSGFATVKDFLSQVETELGQLPALRGELATLRAVLESCQGELADRREEIAVLRSLLHRVREEARQDRACRLRAEERARQADQDRFNAAAALARLEETVDRLIEQIEGDAQLRINEADGRAQAAEVEARELARRLRKERKRRKKIAAERDQLRDEVTISRETIRQLADERDARQDSC